MGDGSLADLEQRFEAHRRNHRVAAAAVAFAVVVGAVGGFIALRDTDSSPRPGKTPASAGAKRVPPPSSKLQFVDERHGWMAVGPHIVATSDGGRTWTTQYRGRLTGLADLRIQFSDIRHGWAISGVGPMLKTTNGGATWQRAPGTDAGWRSIQFVDRRIGWGIQLEPEHRARLLGSLMATKDGGVTWQTEHAPGSSRVAPGVRRPSADAACFVDEKTGWVTGGATIWSTPDGGGRWLGERSLQGPAWTGSIRCVSSNHAWVQLRGDGAAGARPYVVFRTEDGGFEPILQERSSSPLGEKEKIYTAEDPQPGPFTAVSPDAAFFLNYCPPCGATFAVTRTLDGGESWQRFDFPQGVHGEPMGLFFIDEKNGWAAIGRTLTNAQGVTANVFILRTSNGGETWSILSMYRSPS